MDFRDELNAFGPMQPPEMKIDEQAMRVTFELTTWKDGKDEAGDDTCEEIVTEHTLPFVWAVCGACEGRGSYVNPSIDAHGITGEEMGEWDDDERERYFSGGYDVTCEACKGRRVVPQLVEPSNPAQAASWAAYQEWLKDEQQDRRERSAEMRMGY